jgi:Fe-Mn family superoxide dismutase
VSGTKVSNSSNYYSYVMRREERIDFLNQLNKIAAKEWKQAKLPCKAGELSPAMSEATIDYHYGTLYKGYVDKSNKGVGGDFQNAGAFLHDIFFSQMKPYSKENNPTGLISDLIKVEFSSFSGMKKAIKEEAMKIQGSGWIYVDKKGKIKTIKNHEIKKDIVILIDWWEHAWALDYGADKASYLDNIWKILNWDVINSRLD